MRVVCGNPRDEQMDGFISGSLLKDDLMAQQDVSLREKRRPRRSIISPKHVYFCTRCQKASCSASLALASLSSFFSRASLLVSETEYFCKSLTLIMEKCLTQDARHFDLKKSSSGVHANNLFASSRERVLGSATTGLAISTESTLLCVSGPSPLIQMLLRVQLGNR